MATLTGQVIRRARLIQREFHSPIDETPNSLRTSSQNTLYKLWIREIRSSLQGISHMLVNGVPLVPDSRDTTLSVGRIGKIWCILSEHSDGTVLGYT